MESPAAVAVRAPIRFSIAGAFAVAVLVASMIEAPAAVASQGPFGLVGLDKWIHAGSYALLTLLGAYVALTRAPFALLLVAVAATVFGAGVELVQEPIPYRSYERADMVANGLGALFAVAVWRVGWAVRPDRPASAAAA